MERPSDYHADYHTADYRWLSPKREYNKALYEGRI